ncbi:hypothetical protein Cgig2_013927 [Carnegiea gigantea]|uniref:Uncharacterized protein n=1 Tax=Carnegiea gigantea TaxID=171969 RepID=A0A9Q1K2Q0_9CARY|nr:hypothetical protein Cgig2_013927 [Carnegiea gigantea]
MTETIPQQVLEQVKQAMEAANSTRPQPHFDYVPTAGCEPSHRGSTRHPIQTGVGDPIRSIMIGTRVRQSGQVAAPSRGRRPRPPRPLLPVRPTPGGLLSLKNKTRLPGLDGRLRAEQKPTQPQLGMKSVRRKLWPLLLEAMQRVLTIEQGPCITVSTVVFGGKETLCFASPHNDPLAVEMTIARAIVWRILIGTRSSIDIITWDCLKKLTHPGRDIVPLVHPIFGFEGQKVNPTSMICLPIHFGDKLKAKNLEVDFLVVDVATAYNVILGHPTLHKCKYSLKKRKKKTKKKEQGKKSGLHIRISTFLTTLIFRSPGISIQGVSCLIPYTITLIGRRYKLHVLGVLAVVLGLLVLVDVVEHRWYWGSSRSSLQHSAAALTPQTNASAIVTSSLVILERSEVPEVTKSQDLTKSWINKNLAMGSALIKLVYGRWVLGGEPPMA